MIKAVKLYENGFMTQALAFGGEGMEGVDPAVKYRSSLQNYVIDTGSEVILVDTGLPSEFPEQVPDEKTMIYMGKNVAYPLYDMSEIDQYDFWLASYSDYPDFAYDFQIWQYSSTGSVPGIKGNVDLNIAMKRYA